MTTHAASILHDPQIAFCEKILDGYAPLVAHRIVGLSGTREAADELFWNPEVQAYLAARRMELTDGKIKSRRDPNTEDVWFQDLVNVAFANFCEVVLHDIEEPKDLARLPERLQRLVKGWKCDPKNHKKIISIEFEDRAHAKEQVAKYLGIYQKDRENEKDPVNLLQTAFWRYVISGHLHTGKTVAEMVAHAKANPDAVEAWGLEHHLLLSGGEV